MNEIDNPESSMRVAMALAELNTLPVYGIRYVKASTRSASIVALEKRKPMEVNGDNCPNADCKCDVRNWTGDDEFSFCHECGQALKWPGSWRTVVRNNE